MLAEIGKPRAKVQVCKDPLLRGVTEALKWERIQEILDRYRMVQMFLLIVDRDGVEGRRTALDALETRAVTILATDCVFLAENAWQEVEVWLLAGHDLPKDWRWQEIRQDPNSKETYFLPFAQQRGVVDGPGQGRKTLAREAAGKYTRIRSLCPEDIARLEQRLSEKT